MDHAHDHDVSLSLERLVFFSDAVFAIAITLLVLEIPVPELHNSMDDAAYWRALVELLPKFFAFVLSFLVIGRFWIGHHRLFSRVTRYSPRLNWPNMLLLMVMAFMPFATAMLGNNLGAFVPSMFYDLVLLTAGLVWWWLVALVERLGIAPGGVLRDNRGPPSVVLAALFSILICFWLPSFSQFGMITGPLWTRLLGPPREPEAA
jgi:uncharacterized membrane protein